MSDDHAIELGYPSPPRLHWAVVLVLSIVTIGVFGYIWALVLSFWLKRVRASSSAQSLFSISALLAVGELASRLLPRLHSQSGWLALSAAIVWVIAAFTMREDLLIHYNGDEPIGLSLGVWATLFFSICYFQFHLSEIARLQRSVTLSDD
jgi:hypothetical protein